MNIRFQSPKSRAPGKSRAAFSLPEIMISMTLFVLLIGGIVVVNLFGLRWFQIAQVKMLASDSARKAIGHMSDEIRASTSVYVGGVTNNAFTACASGNLQQGGSLLIYTSTNNTNYILYFYNQPDGTFRRLNTAVGTTTILAKTVTNSASIFQVQDCLGNVLSNTLNNSLIHCSLQFYSSGTTNPVADFYKLETAATPRLNN